MRSNNSGPSTPLREHFAGLEWRGSPECLESVLSWLASNQVTLVLDLAELGQVSRLPGVQALSSEAVAFVQKEVEV